MPSDQRDDQQRHDVDDLDQRVDGRTCGVLVGIAYGITGYRRLVGLGAFTSKVVVLNVLLGVVPCTTTGGHGDGHEQAGDDRADQHAAQGFRAQDDPDDDGN